MRVLPTRWRRKPTGIDIERNYVTVTLCIKFFQFLKINTADDVFTRRILHHRDRSIFKTVTVRYLVFLNYFFNGHILQKPILHQLAKFCGPHHAVAEISRFSFDFSRFFIN